jgi:formamidopyrimidine-DNA glycosylase
VSRRVAGVGNIYADEALFRARIHPLRPVGMLKRAQLDALALAVTDAFTAGGATIDDFRHPGGVRGAFQSEFLIHLRAGEPCVRWASTGVKMVAAGRGTYARAQRRRPQPVAAAR